MTTCIEVIMHVASNFHNVPACPCKLFKFMSSVQETQSVDRELFSELSESQVDDRGLFSELSESPVKPAFVHMCVPCKDDPLGSQLQVNGEALWQWWNIKSPSQLFDILQNDLVKKGYCLSLSSRARVGMNLKRRLDYNAQKIHGTTGGKARQAMQSKYWCTIAIHPEEIAQGPGEIIDQLKNTEEELVRENQTQRWEESAAIVLCWYTVRYNLSYLWASRAQKKFIVTRLRWTKTGSHCSLTLTSV